MGRNILLGVIALIMGAILYMYSNRPAYTESNGLAYDLEFNSMRWKAGPDRTRGAMVKSLMESDTLIGMNTIQVKAMLGSPDFKIQANYIYKVDLGHSMNPGADSWPYGFIVVFDSVGVVTQTGLTD